MKFPKLRRGRQLNLAFNYEVQNFTVCTSTIGDFFEEATLRLFGGIRYTTESGVSYCPDIRRTQKQYLEVKASGRSSRVILYKRRIEREMKWCEENGFEIEYVIWSHNCYTKECRNSQELLDSLAETTSYVLRVPIQMMLDAANEIPLRNINRWNPEGYNFGWLIPIKRLLDRCNTSTPRQRLKVDRQVIRNFTIHTYDASKSN